MTGQNEGTGNWGGTCARGSERQMSWVQDRGTLQGSASRGKLWGKWLPLCPRPTSLLPLGSHSSVSTIHKLAHGSSGACMSSLWKGISWDPQEILRTQGLAHSGAQKCLSYTSNNSGVIILLPVIILLHQ